MSAAHSPEGATRGERPIAVWDVPTRAFHWLAVLAVLAAYATARLNWMDWHARAGYGLLALVLFRLLWAFFGGETARFSAFLASPRAAVRHLAHALRREPDVQVGHNPAGGWMVLLLLLLLLGLTLSGLYVGDDIAEEGPLTERVSAPVANLIDALHDTILWDALLVAIALHLLAILAYAVAKGHNLVLPMITGRKTLPMEARAPRMQSAARALFLFACAALAALALVKTM